MSRQRAPFKATKGKKKGRPPGASQSLGNFLSEKQVRSLTGIEGNLIYSPIANEQLSRNICLHSMNEIRGTFTNAAAQYLSNEIAMCNLTNSMDVAGAPTTTTFVTGQSITRTSEDRFRVLAFMVKMTLINREPTPIIVFAGFSNEGVSKQNSSSQNYMLNPSYKRVTLMGSGNADACRTTIHLPWTRTDKFVGNRTTAFDDNFAGPTSTNTAANNVWLNFGAVTVEGGNFTVGLGIDYVSENHQQVLFFEPTSNVA